MVCRGTGIAHFALFCRNASTVMISKKLVVFGDRNAATDYIYCEELENFQQRLVTRLDLAIFSRDQEPKFMYKTGCVNKALICFCGWSRRLFLLCGDAYRMAKDVDHALHVLLLNMAKFQTASHFITSTTKKEKLMSEMFIR